MADGERRMLFDTRGRRRNVIRVVYVILAVLMGGSLFLTVGPFNLSELGGAGGGGDAADVFHDQEERLEERLAKEPNNEGLLLSLTRARIGAGQAQTDTNPQTGRLGVPPSEAQEDYDEAVESWNRYLKLAGDEPSPSAAVLVAQTYFGLAEGGGSVSFSYVQENLEIALSAQRIVAKAQPNPGSFSNLAIYEYFNGNFEEGDKAAKRALAGVPKAEAKNAKKQLDEYRKNAKSYVAQSEQFAKAEEQAGGGGAPGEFQNPFGGFGTGTPGAPAE